MTRSGRDWWEKAAAAAFPGIWRMALTSTDCISNSSHPSRVRVHWWESPAKMTHYRPKRRWREKIFCSRRRACTRSQRAGGLNPNRFGKYCECGTWRPIPSSSSTIVRWRWPKLKPPIRKWNVLFFPRSDYQALWLLLRRLRGLFGKPFTSEEDRLRLKSIRDASGFRDSREATGAPLTIFLRR